MKRTPQRLRVCICLLIANLAFIWGNSLLPGSVSEAVSQWVGQLVEALTHLPVGGGGSGGGLLRKAAHFTEFACLGALLAWLAGMAGEYGAHLWTSPLLGAMTAACADEALQTLIPDRGPSVLDVWLDVFGASCGIGLLLWVHARLRKRYTGAGTGSQ